jgi:hypothetical protein
MAVRTTLLAFFMESKAALEASMVVLEASSFDWSFE